MEESLEKPPQAPQFGGKPPGRPWRADAGLLCYRGLCPAPSPAPRRGGEGPGPPPGSVPDSLLHLWSSSTCSSSSACTLQATALAPLPSWLPFLHTHTHTHTHTFISFNLSAEINFSIPLIIFSCSLLNSLQFVCFGLVMRCPQTRCYILHATWPRLYRFSC